MSIGEKSAEAVVASTPRNGGGAKGRRNRRHQRDALISEARSGLKREGAATAAASRAAVPECGGGSHRREGLWAASEGTGAERERRERCWQSE